jgi:hypothetical protein
VARILANSWTWEDAQCHLEGDGPKAKPQRLPEARVTATMFSEPHQDESPFLLQKSAINCLGDNPEITTSIDGDGGVVPTICPTIRDVNEFGAPTSLMLERNKSTVVRDRRQSHPAVRQ